MKCLCFIPLVFWMSSFCGCSYFNTARYQDDNLLEEFIEYTIARHLAVDVDLTPSSEEK